eukprot:TRINITY_DN178_c0_g1_i2.p1 TRINITY_DN178_c0_g1~~TRINITY_DN178_c0_g1_i2.p1  ORF type:complete len:528 (-),score=99.72 TRINITY_DN178_c0_g1_i2:140-1723(-)
MMQHSTPPQYNGGGGGGQHPPQPGSQWWGNAPPRKQTAAAADDYLPITTTHHHHHDPPTDHTSSWAAVVGRWHVLFTFSFLSFSQCLVWFTFSSVDDPIKEYYHISDAEIDLLLNWGPIVFIPAVFLVWGMQMYLTNGLRIAFWIGCGLTFTGAFVRTIPCWLDESVRHSFSSLWLLHFGQILNACCGAVVMALCSKLSVVWFPNHQRATATAIAYSMNNSGTALGFLMGPGIVKTAKDTPILLYTQLAIAFLPIVGGFLYFPETPPTPPSDIAASYKAGARDELTLRDTLWRFVRVPSFWLVIFAGGLLGGVTSGWQGVLPQILDQVGYDNTKAGYMGFGNVLAGIIGGVVAGPIVDRFFVRRYKLFLLLIFSAALSLFVFFTLSLKMAYAHQIIPSNIWTLSIAISLAGFLQGSLGPVLFELSAELIYPVPEATSGSLLVLFFNGATVVVLFVAPLVNSGWMNTVQTGAVAICLVLVVLVRERYNRLDAEAAIANEGVASPITFASDGPAATAGVFAPHGVVVVN